MSNWEILEKGHRYIIHLEDCCILATFSGVFEGWFDENGKEFDLNGRNIDDLNEYPFAKFDTGSVGKHYGKAEYILSK